MITIQGGDFQPIPFDEIVDPVTGRGRRRPVDIETESYRVARDYMVRLGPKDFVSEEWVAQVGRERRSFSTGVSVALREVRPVVRRVRL